MRRRDRRGTQRRLRRRRRLPFPSSRLADSVGADIRCGRGCRIELRVPEERNLLVFLGPARRWQVDGGAGELDPQSHGERRTKGPGRQGFRVRLCGRKRRRARRPV